MLYNPRKIYHFFKDFRLQTTPIPSIISKVLLRLNIIIFLFHHILILIPFLPLKENFMNKFLKVQIKNQILK
jgi:hypothetical protein